MSIRHIININYVEVWNFGYTWEGGNIISNSFPPLVVGRTSRHPNYLQILHYPQPDMFQRQGRTRNTSFYFWYEGKTSGFVQCQRRGGFIGPTFKLKRFIILIKLGSKISVAVKDVTFVRSEQYWQVIEIKAVSSWPRADRLDIMGNCCQSPNHNQV